MKITEEIWDKYDSEVRKLNSLGSDYEKEVDYYNEIMKRITGKHINILDLYNLRGVISDVGFEKLTDYFINVLPSKFNLDPGYMTVVDISNNTVTPFGIFDHEICGGFGNISNLHEYPLFLYGEDIVIVLYKHTTPTCSTDGVLRSISEYENKEGIAYKTATNSEEDGRIGLCGNMILYTSDKTKEVIEIIKDYSEFINTLPKLSIPEPAPDTISVGFVYRSPNGLSLYRRNVKVSDITLNEFNEDLPNDEIINKLHKDGSGLFIFHGEPGCGKSSYIKYLIKTCKDKNFIVVSQDILIGSMDDFRTLLLTGCNDDSIIIIEDCENLVKSRELVGSSLVISDFLNITDGIYGDLFRIKFILTFNTEIQKIDSALLRKGRLKCKYKFERLHGQKLKNLASEIGIEVTESQISNGMTLADLYNHDSNIGNNDSKNSCNKIGFTK